jgi:hypothetical protein
MFLLDSAVALRENAHGRSADHCDGRISAIGSGHRPRNGKNKYVRRVLRAAASVATHNPPVNGESPAGAALRFEAPVAATPLPLR